MRHRDTKAQRCRGTEQACSPLRSGSLRAFVPLCLCAFAPLLFYPSPAAAGIVETIRQRYSGAASFSADVDLSVRWLVREKTESHSGKLWLAPGDRFRVELGPTTWVSDGKALWQYNSQMGQVIIRRLKDIDLADYPSQLLSTYLNGYTYQVLEDTERQAVLRWQADSAARASSLYQAITIHYDKKKCAVTSLLVVDRQQNESTYLFKRSTFGAAPGPAVFTFDVPKGARVLDERN
jgi:outer membrane lipoprotein-sorting protein